MEDLQRFLSDIKHLERSLFGLILSSFIFSLLAILAQYDKFDVPFKALTELVGGTMGSAAILSAYLGRLRHPADKTSNALNFQPRGNGIIASLSLFVSIAMFYLFYVFARNESEACLFFLAVGMFTFFRTLASAAITMRRAEEQKLAWRQMSEEERRNWQKKQEAEREANIKKADDANKILMDSKLLIEKVECTERELRRELRKDRWRDRIEFFKKLWLRIRRNIGGESLLTRKEREILELDELRKKQVLQAPPWVTEPLLASLDWDLRQKHIHSIRAEQVRSMKLEAIGEDIYNIEDQYFYFFLPAQIGRDMAIRYMEILPALREATQLHNPIVTAVLPLDARITVEAKRILLEGHILIVEEMNILNSGKNKM